MDLNTYRELFPITLQKIYLNHAAISPLSTRVTDMLEWYLDERSFGDIDTFRQVSAIRQEARDLLAKMINGSAEHIAFITNTSEGFNHLVNGLSWQAGDQIILTDYEFPSNVYPFMNLERFGVDMVYVPNRDGQIRIEDIEERITPRTKMLSISFVEFSNGFRNDLETIGKLCKANDIIFSVDSIQGLGAIPLDVQKFQIDFLSNGGHKWLMGAMGAGFMYFAPELFEKITPAFTGWLGVENAWDFFDYKLDLLPDAGRFEYATGNFLGISALRASAGLLMEAGIENIERHLMQLGQRLIDGLGQPGLRFKGAADKKYWSGIYSFAGKDMPEFYEYLMNRNIICSLRNGMLRVSPHFYNNEEEIDELISRAGEFYKNR